MFSMGITLTWADFKRVFSQPKAFFIGLFSQMFMLPVVAFIIAVIQNGMNLTNVESYTQKVVLGLVILGAVLVDTAKKRGWLRWRPKKLMRVLLQCLTRT